ncbi:MAG TPA: hypothetical protein VIK55_09675 [Paludibacter sp.]
MRRIFTSILLLTIMSNLTFSQTKNADISGYVTFVEDQQTSAKDYILNLFKKYDIVVLCERNHPETTQYELFYDIASSPFFIRNVGNIFTEVGSISNSQNTLNFIKTKFKNDSIKQLKQAEVYENGFFPPLWNNTNFYEFTGKLNTLNGRLGKRKQINLFTSGTRNPTTEQRKNIENMKQYIMENYPKRDSLMASYIITTFDSIRKNSSRKKALVIMNYRHAFSKSLLNDGTINVGEYLKRHYEGKFANVYINSLASTLNIPIEEKKKPQIFQCGDQIPIQYGKWDAAFLLGHKENSGFNFQYSPFGKDSLDIWPFSTNCNYEDIFTGFVYYLPIEKHRLSNGVKNFYRGVDVDQIIRDWNLFNKALGKNEENKCTPEFKADLEQEMSIERSVGYPNLKQYEIVIDQWLKK